MATRTIAPAETSLNGKEDKHTAAKTKTKRKTKASNGNCERPEGLRTGTVPASSGDIYAGLPTGELAELRQEETGSEIGNHGLGQFDHKAETSMLQAALRLAERGFPVFPCVASGKDAKHPSFKGWQQKATKDASTIAGWWSRNFREHALGLPTGDASGVFVVDVDTKNGAKGLESLAALEEQHGPLPATFRVRTPSGGLHIYFKMPPGIEIGNSGPKKGKPGRLGFGIDVRGTGGLVLVAPSSLLGDDEEVVGCYESIDRSAVADPPPWLVGLLKERLQQPDVAASTTSASISWAAQVLDQQCSSVEKAQEGERNNTLNEAAFVLGQVIAMGALDRGSVEERLRSACRACGLSDREAARTIGSGVGAGTAEPSASPFFVDFTAKGGIDTRSWRNVAAFLDWVGVRLRRNEFTNKDEVSGLECYPVLDDDALIVLLDKAHKAGFRLGREFLLERLKATALEHAYHPVRIMLDELEWDGAPRIDTWLASYLGAVDSEYMRAVGSKALIAAVRRVRRPGCKFDTMLILEGSQGTGKSTALEVLATRREWFTDCVSLTHDSKVMIEQTEGKLIVEIPELQGMRRAEVEHVKANLSRTHDQARKAFGRLTSDVPRQFIMIGTTNTDKDGRAWYLKDHTGNRRFWPVKTGEIDLEKLGAEVGQLWAEAAHREAQGEQIALPRELWKVAELEQTARLERDPWIDELSIVLGGRIGKILTAEARRIVSKNPLKPHEESQLGRAMRELGWSRDLRRHNGDRAYFYVKKEGAYSLKHPGDGLLTIDIAKEGTAAAQYENRGEEEHYLKWVKATSGEPYPDHPY